MTTFREIHSALTRMGFQQGRPVILHAALSAFDNLRGGADTLLGAVLATAGGVMMPAFTFKTMIIPESGPPDNAICYGSGKDANRMAEVFTPEMPADKSLGVVAETLRAHPDARRSMHPILSFSGIGVEQALDSQSLLEPFAPIHELVERDGWVLLAGVNHTVNTSIHHVERLSGRKQFIRWALSAYKVVECPGFPGCSYGFKQAEPLLEMITLRASVGGAEMRALPLQPMVDVLADLFAKDPLALLCQREDCELCAAVRAVLA